MNRPGITTPLLALLMMSGAAAQEIPSLPPPPWQSAGEDPRKPALAAAARATAEQAPTEAVRHLLNALWYRPFDTKILADLAQASREDPDRSFLWCHALFQAAADAKGVFQPDRAFREALPESVDLELLDRLCQARAQAVAEIAEYQTRLQRERTSAGIGHPILVHFLRSLAFQISRYIPSQWPTHGSSLNAACAPRRNAYQPVVTALKRVMTDGLANRRTEQSIRAARCLTGLAHQGNFKDLKGPEAPNLDLILEQAADGLRRAREQLRAAGEPLTIDILSDMSDEECQQFTREHASFSNPGVALSRTDKYRIETVCGHDTLLGVAETIELHHDRLVNFFGKDPFEGRQGLVRIVPEAEGLEAEGAPFWWVGGFQGGDVTTLRFHAGSITGLGRGITHELTHRFDGAIYPGMPAWLVEGRAVYTGGAYGRMDETSFAENHGDFGTMFNTMRKGYGGLSKLTELIEGTIDDYRDNYVAGYALYVYLKSWEEIEGQPLFRKRLQIYMEEANKGQKNPKKWFETAFCDGKEGRPKSLEEFAQRFSTFINGFYWLDLKPWTSRYEVKFQEEPAPFVFDAPNWQFSRNRAEPWFGQGQAARAGELLLQYGRPQDAARAFVWAFELDEWSVRRAMFLADLLESFREERPAWVLRNESRRRAAWAQLDPVGPSPLLTSLPKVKALVKLLEKTSSQQAELGHPLSSAALAAEHNLLAERLGLEPLSNIKVPDAAAVAAPFEPPPRYAGHLGWIEDDLTGYEEFRVKNLWYETESSDLHVGRSKPRDKTGQMDRNAYQHDAFTRSQDWLTPGYYRIKTRIHFTTTYVSGAIVVGHTRRDRNIRFSFTAGDYMYSIGQKEDAAELDSVSTSLGGIRDGENAAWGQTASKGVKFEHPSTWFAVELLVFGPHVMAFVNDQPVGVYHTADGLPIEGYVGFAASFGAYRLEAPTISPLDQQRALGLIDQRTFGLNLSKDGPVHRRDLLNRPVTDIPLAPQGTVVVWTQAPVAEDWEDLTTEEALAFESRRRTYTAARCARTAANLLYRLGCSQKLVLALPEFLSKADLEVLEAELKRPPEVRCEQLIHRKDRDLWTEEGEPIATEMPMILFVDPHGVLRGMAPFTASMNRLPSELDYWLNVFRGRKPAGEN